MPLRGWLCLAGAILCVGCGLWSPEEARYLRGREGKLTETEVQARLGPPLFSIRAGPGAIWVYQRQKARRGGWLRAPGLWCEEYTLRFDRTAMLREWARQEYLHVGEYQPEVCVPGGLHFRGTAS